MDLVLPIEKIALDILKQYNGTNDYILELQKDYHRTKTFVLTRKQAEYIKLFNNVQPVELNRYVQIHKSCREFVQQQLGLDTAPERIYVNKLLSRRSDMLHFWGCFGEDCKSYRLIYVAKECLKKLRQVPNLDFSDYTREPKPHQITAITKLLENEKYILADEMGLGKCLINNTLCYTPKGRVEIGNIKIGDKVIGSDGKPYNVTGVFPQGVKDLYQITFNDGYSVKCCKEHLWTVSSNNSGENSKNRENRYVTLSVEQMLDKDLVIEQKGTGWNKKRPYKFSTYYKLKNGNSKWQIPIVKPIEFYNNDILPIEPYLLGVCLGDGNVNNTWVKIELHKDDFDEIFIGVDLNERNPVGNKRSCNIKFGDKLRILGLNNKTAECKTIPNIYKYSSIENRLAILQGLMDTDGHCMKSKNGVFAGTEYTTVSEQLADDVAEIVHSLGGIVRKHSKIGSYKKEDGTKVICKRCFRLNIKMPEGMNPFRLKRKANAYNPPKKYKVGRYIKDIKPCGRGEAVCISVDSPDKLYVTEHAIVTHNTTSAIIAAVEGKFERILVVCPASLKINWKKEIMNYDKEENISIIDSGGFKMKKWTIVNYDILKNYHYLPQKGVNIDELTPSVIDFYKFDLVIADEAHYLKNATSNRTKIFIDFASRIPNRWFLTGTPITNKPIDFYTMLYLCESPIATNWMHFVRRYCAGRQIKRPGTNKKFWLTSGASNLDELRDYSADVMLRRTKKDSIDLPQKTIKPIYLPMEFSASYNQYLREYEEWVDSTENLEEKPKITDHLTRLLKIRQLLSYDKLKYTIETIEDLIENEQKVIVFSCFTNTINALHDHFGKASVLIDGSVSSKKRDEAVHKFQNDPKIKVFCGNIVAAGVGLTLTESSVVIFNDLDWTPANHAQAEDRAHRIGQEKPVHIIYPLFDDTLDTIMFQTLQRKMKIISQIMGDKVDFEDISMAKEIIEALKS